MNTRRLRFEVLGPDHAEVLFDDLVDERIYTFLPEQPPASVEALRARYAILARGLPPERDEQWLNWVMVRVADGRPIGWLQATVYPGARHAEVAWVVFPHAWRQGFGAEGTGWMIRHLQERFAVSRVTAEIDTRNLPSLALAEGLAFTRQETVPTDEGEDHVYVRSFG